MNCSHALNDPMAMTTTSFSRIAPVQDGCLEINNQKYELPEGSAFFIPAKKPHCYYPDGDVWDIRWMVPGGNSLTPLYHKYNLENGGVFTLHDESELDRILNQNPYGTY